MRTARLIALVLVLASCALVNVRGEVHGWSVNHMWWEHGWPITWLGRDSCAQIGGRLAIIEVRQEDKYGRADPMWPWNLAPGQGYRFSYSCLAVDVAAVGILVLGTYFAFPITARTPNRLQFSIKVLFVVQALVGIIACLIVNFPVVVLNLAYLGLILGVVFTLFTFGRTACTVAASRRSKGRTNNPQPQGRSPLDGAGPAKMVE